MLKTANSILVKILNFWLVKIVISILTLLVIASIVEDNSLVLFQLLGFNAKVAELVSVIISSIVLILFYTKILDKYYYKNLTDSKSSFWYNVLLGFILGALIQCFIFLIIYINNGYAILSINPISFLVPGLIISIKAAVAEEIRYRGIFFKIIEQKFGSYFGIIVSAIFFGAAHLFGSNATLLGSISIALSAGVLLSLLYIYTRSLWLLMAFHFAWNFFESNVFGATVSGFVPESTLVTSKISGSELITGGVFGPESSVQSVLICVALSVILFYLCKKENKFVFMGELNQIH